MAMLVRKTSEVSSTLRGCGSDDEAAAMEFQDKIKIEHESVEAQEYVEHRELR